MVKVARISFEQVQINRCAAWYRMFMAVGDVESARRYMRYADKWQGIHNFAQSRGLL